MHDVSSGSVTVFLNQLQQGDYEGAEELWRYFFLRLVTLARKKLHSSVRRVIDDEDIALKALEECFRNIQAGKYPSIRDRDNLWALLAKTAERRAANANRDQLRAKRGGGRVRGESFFISRDDSVALGPDSVAGREPTPQMITEFTEDFEARLLQLGEKERPVAVYKLEGLTNYEIGTQLNISVATVERRLRNIRDAWTDQVS